MNTTNKYLSIDLEAKRDALAKAEPLLKGGVTRPTGTRIKNSSPG
jgi:hypothetical protein